MEFPKILESKAKIRFQNCDPFNHLNNAANFDYLINGREDHVIKACYFNENNNYRYTINQLHQ